jgi:hypothetical protein
MHEYNLIKWPALNGNIRSIVNATKIKIWSCKSVIEHLTTISYIRNSNHLNKNLFLASSNLPKKNKSQPLKSYWPKKHVYT